MISIDEMETMLDEIAEELPKELYRELNGGVVLLPQTKMNGYSVASDLYTMGEYHRSTSMGRYIAIYYGSFARVYGHLSKEKIKEQLKKTLQHEFTHHLESLAGTRDLEIEDERQIEEYMRKHRHRGGRYPMP